jgi:hypothetical protein
VGVFMAQRVGQDERVECVGLFRGQPVLESSGIKLSGAVASLTGVSSRAMLDAWIRGERDPWFSRSMRSDG